MTDIIRTDDAAVRARRDVIVISVADGAGVDVDRLLRQGRAALPADRGETSVWTSSGMHLLVLSTGGLGQGGGTLTVSGATSATTTGEHVTQTAGAAARAAAPWAAVAIAGTTARLTGDGVGLKHLYLVQERRWAAASTSALALGRLVGRGLDPAAWGAQALLGFLTGTRTVAAGVARVPVGHTLTLAEGRAHLSERPPPSQDEGVGQGPELLRDVVAGMLHQHPDLGLELSGGLDSRVLLACLTDEERAGRTALTIGEHDHEDVRVARRLARRCQLDHRVVAPPDASRLDPATALAQTLASGRVREHASDALAAWVLDDVEARAPAGPRLTGVNGEFVRGFYYPATPRHGPVTRARVARLARWRMFANHRTTDHLLDADWVAEQERRVIDEITRTMSGYDLEWRPATDEYYLRERIPNWAGPGYSHAATQRPVLAPFTSPAFLAWARSVAPERRADSLALVEVLVALDAGLAQIPVASGPAPAALVRRGAAASVSRSARMGRRLAAKARQRLRDERRPPAGAATLVPVLRDALREASVLHELAAVDFLDAAGLEGLASGALVPDQPTTSFLVNLIGTRRLLHERARADGAARPGTDVAQEPSP